MWCGRGWWGGGHTCMSIPTMHPIASEEGQTHACGMA